MNSAKQFFKEARAELMKVNWPSKEQTIRYTMAVVGISVTVAIFLGGLDFIFEQMLNKFILQ